MPTSTPRPCWWCGAPADSREHKFKKTDVARASKTWAIDDKPYYFGENGWKPIQGPNSKLVKFDKVLCEACNTTRSQPLDRAYDAFVAWVRQKGADLMREDAINFTEVYGDPYNDEVLNLLKYFAKHLGCRIASNDAAFPPAFVAMLDSSAMPKFSVTLSRNAEIKGIPIRGGGALHNFPFLARYSPSSGDVRPPYQYGCIVGYLDVIYRYDDESHFEWEGEPIDPSRRVTKLGLYMAGAPHPSNGQLAGSAGDRKLEIGGYEFEVPILSRDQIQQVIAIGLPSSEMTLERNLDARIRIVYVILSPFYPDLTIEFLKDNLTVEASNALWKYASGQSLSGKG